MKRQAAKAGKRTRKAKAATLDVLDSMIATCDGSLTGLRDRALQALAFASGGRRRSELTALQVTDLEVLKGCDYLVTVNRSKTDQFGAGLTVPCRGRCATYLREWIAGVGIKSGFLFRSINRHGQLGESFSAQSVALVVKDRAKLAGLNPAGFSGHSLRSGFVTQAGRDGIAPGDAMAPFRPQESDRVSGVLPLRLHPGKSGR